MNNENAIYANALNQNLAIGAVRFGRLLSYFRSFKKAYNAPEKELREAQLPPKVIANLIVRRREIDPEREWEVLAENDIKAVTLLDKSYPALLKEIYDPPGILYYKGDLAILNKPGVGIVGTRKATAYGQSVVANVIEGLAEFDLITISGLALGIDTSVHQESLKNKLKTVAVIGASLDEENIYPASNQNLACEIVSKGGLLLSEFPLYTRSYKSNFPLRNRIISGLSRGVVVVEAGKRSGALITAYQALEQNREVLAVPGNINQPKSEGTNRLIQKGAKLLLYPQEILTELNLSDIVLSKIKPCFKPADDLEKKIYEVLREKPADLDALAANTGLSAAEISSTLTGLEIKKVIRRENNFYILS